MERKKQETSETDNTLEEQGQEQEQKPEKETEQEKPEEQEQKEKTEEQEKPEQEEKEEEYEARPEGQKKMWKIKCSACGKEAEVPFKPIEGRPVYCRECFMKRRNRRYTRRFPRRY